MKEIITFIGMSGVGKSFTSQRLAEWGWYRYSCDEEIGADLLRKDNLSEDELMSAIQMLVGRLGNVDRGGLSLFEFKKRQAAYYHGECRALLSLDRHIEKAEKAGFDVFIHDSTGSFCEIDDPIVLESVARLSQICYIEASKEHIDEVIDRAQKFPKPLFYPHNRLDGWVTDYLADHNLDEVQDIDPDDFSRWVFPKLFKQRLPKYKALAKKYGFVVPSEALYDVENQEDFIKIIDQYRPS